MELDLSPKLPQKLFEGDGGSYYSWSSSEFEVAKIGAGKLVLNPLGFILPHYSDSPKICYVLEGTGMVGMVSTQNPKEKIIKLETGKTIQLPLATVSWWYNDGESQLAILFVGDTSTSLVPGEFNSFFLTGSAGIFAGFSTEFITNFFGIKEEDANTLFRSQPGFLTVKLKEKLVDVKALEGNEEELLVYSEVVDIGSHGIWRPRFSALPVAQVVYVNTGSGRFEVVGMNGRQVFDAELKGGELFVVPKFFIPSAIAGAEGLECISVTMSPKHAFGTLIGENSVLNALSPQILRASLNVDQDLVKLLSLKTQEK